MIVMLMMEMEMAEVLSSGPTLAVFSWNCLKTLSPFSESENRQWGEKTPLIQDWWNVIYLLFLKWLTRGPLFCLETKPNVTRPFSISPTVFVWGKTNSSDLCENDTLVFVCWQKKVVLAFYAFFGSMCSASMLLLLMIWGFIDVEATENCMRLVLNCTYWCLSPLFSRHCWSCSTYCQPHSNHPTCSSLNICMTLFFTACLFVCTCVRCNLSTSCISLCVLCCCSISLGSNKRRLVFIAFWFNIQWNKKTCISPFNYFPCFLFTHLNYQLAQTFLSAFAWLTWNLLPGLLLKMATLFFCLGLFLSGNWWLIFTPMFCPPTVQSCFLLALIEYQQYCVQMLLISHYLLPVDLPPVHPFFFPLWWFAASWWQHHHWHHPPGPFLWEKGKGWTYIWWFLQVQEHVTLVPSLALFFYAGLVCLVWSCMFNTCLLFPEQPATLIVDTTRFSIADVSISHTKTVYRNNLTY